MMSEATAPMGRGAGRTHGAGHPGTVVELRCCQDGDRAAPLRVKYHPPVTLNWLQRTFLAWRYGVGPRPTRSRRFLFALLAPPGWHLWS